MKILLSFILLLSFARADGLTLEELQQSFQHKRLKIEDAGKSKLSILREKYLAALGKLKTKYQESGRLDDTLAVQAEMDDILSEKWPLQALAENAPADLFSARKIYFKNHLTTQRETGDELIDAVTTMEKLLEQQIVSLTKDGDLAGAQTAKQFQKELNDDQEIKKFRTLLARVRADGSSSVGMRIRRAGDNLEVLVRYDSSGKISPKSKIVNVIEITDGKKEKGETRATTLGEFIGSPGSTVDPYIALSKIFNDRTLSPIHATALESQFLKEDLGEKGVRLVSIAKPVNTHVSLGYCLPSLSEKGTYEVDIRYFVPKTNKVLRGIRFVQGVGSQIPGSDSKEIGKWDTLTFRAASSHELKNLLLYLSLEPKANGIQSAGDYLSLGSVSVKHIAFTAFLVERFNKDGSVVETIPIATEQKQIAQNGLVLSQN